jgi:WD40 repeat protein
VDEAQRDDADPVDTVTARDPDSNSRAQVGVEATAIMLCITFSPDLRCMVVDGAIRLRDTQTGDEASLLGHARAISFVAFTPDGKRIVSASFDHTIRIWNSETGDMVLGPLRGHTGWVHSAVFSPDGR